MMCAGKKMKARPRGCCLLESGCDVVHFDKNKTFPRGIGLGGRGGIGVAGQQPSSVQMIMPGRHIWAFVVFVACGSDII